MDLPGAVALRADMDDDRRNLIIGLCTQVGMIMEDIGDIALTMRGVTDDNLAARIAEIDRAVRRMLALISAAAALEPQDTRG